VLDDQTSVDRGEGEGEGGEEGAVETRGGDEII